MANENAENKIYDPTPEKLRSLSEKGEVPSQRELSQSIVFGLSVFIFAGSIYYLSNGYLVELSELQVSWSQSGGSVPRSGLSISLVRRVTFPTSLVFGFVLFVAVLIGAGMNPSRPRIKRIRPDMNRLNPIENFSHKFSADSLLTFFRNALAMVLCFVALISLYALFAFYMDVRLFYDLPLAFAQLTYPLIVLLAAYAGILLLSSVFDLAYKRMFYFLKHRMTRQELTDEQKATEGDPHLKAERRNLAVQLLKDDARNIQDADVVMVNPTHYIIALTWNGAEGSAPICLCKGQGERAKLLNELAVRFGIPIYRDVAAVRSMYPLLEVGGEVPASHYKPVAAAITFARRVSGVRSATGNTSKYSS